MKSHCFGHLLQLMVSIVNPLVTETSIVDSMFTKFQSLTLYKKVDILNTSACGYFNWESLTLAKAENSKVSCKEFCTITLFSSEVKYWKWEQIVSCHLSAKLASF